MPGLHAVLSPSSAKMWCTCPPSARLNQKYRDLFGDKSSPYAAEGTKAHSVCELKLRHEIGEINDFSFNEQLKTLGDIPNEMDRVTDEYVDIVLSEYYQMKRMDPATQIFIEQRLDMSEWISGCFGTSDCVIVSDLGLIVIDYKNGQGVPVSAVGNYQARIYALGAYAMFKGLYSFHQVKYMIVQPRLDSVSDETMEISDLLVWANEVVRPAAQLAWRGEGQFKAGEHCRFCAVKAICRENVLSALSVMQNMFDSPDVLNDAQVSAILPFVDRAEDWLKDLRAYALSRALSGETIRGYKLVRGKRPSRVWTDEDSVIDQLSRAGYAPEQYTTKPKLKSVAELEKTLKKGAFDALVGRYVFQGDGALTLVPDDDKREAYSPAMLAFGDLVDPNNQTN